MSKNPLVPPGEVFQEMAEDGHKAADDATARQLRDAELLISAPTGFAKTDRMGLLSIKPTKGIFKPCEELTASNAWYLSE